MMRLILFSAFCLIVASCQKESQVDRATRDGILIMGNSSDPKSFDPQVVSGVLENNIIRALFEGLINFDQTVDLATPGGVAMEVTPDETATVWTARLRPGLKWSDGEPLTAEDFAFSYERILSPGLNAKYASMLYFMEGAEDFNLGKITDFTQVGIKIEDPLTFTITLRGPTPFFREILKHYTWYPVPKHKVLQYGSIDRIGSDWAKPENLVGNGPFRIKSFRRNDHIEVERNPYYWDAENVSLNGIRFLPISNVFTEARMFRDGQLHVTYTAAPEVVDLMKKEDPGSLRQEPYLGTVLYRFNTTRKPLDDPRVRRALSMALDREALCENVFRGYEPAYGMTPPMGDYDPPHGAAFDPEGGRKLLAEAGFPEGKGFPRLKLLIASRESAATLASAVQAMWRNHLGVEVEIENKEWTAYIVATQNLNYDIVAGGWIGDYIDPLTFLEMWMPGNGNNNTGWESKPFAAKIEESFQRTDAAERFKLLGEAEEILLADSPVAPVAWWGKNYLLHPSVKGWEPLLLDSHPYTKVKLVPDPRPESAREGR
ncbi:peptide ABC transporter substrate-binding protein [Luteolibacter algae]|uniref:Peptide ABC transporter substrate-binding protein n=1 Tax=Luteolibacter algae TaxID=454151 RepID=A0ABW5D4N8_9BACT